MILVAIVIVLLVAFLLWYGFGPWDEPWRLDDDDAPVITSLYEYKRERRP